MQGDWNQCNAPSGRRQQLDSNSTSPKNGRAVLGPSASDKQLLLSESLQARQQNAGVMNWTLANFGQQPQFLPNQLELHSNKPLAALQDLTQIPLTMNGPSESSSHVLPDAVCQLFLQAVATQSSGPAALSSGAHLFPPTNPNDMAAAKSCADSSGDAESKNMQMRQSVSDFEQNQIAFLAGRDTSAAAARTAPPAATNPTDGRVSVFVSDAPQKRPRTDPIAGFAAPIPNVNMSDLGADLVRANAQFPTGAAAMAAAALAAAAGQLPQRMSGAQAVGGMPMPSHDRRPMDGSAANGLEVAQRRAILDSLLASGQCPKAAPAADANDALLRRLLADYIQRRGMRDANDGARGGVANPDPQQTAELLRRLGAGLGLPMDQPARMEPAGDGLTPQMRELRQQQQNLYRQLYQQQQQQQLSQLSSMPGMAAQVLGAPPGRQPEAGLLAAGLGYPGVRP
eukprot:CAMPEP_0113689668 /NCGR_PEP_ID=MMETSP0038_2-20120614/17316_1 /TAXON_ID=2898 /ORGANISM="Cryptomonas paramecium" /LENGTH=454 /DNA_ID=CAMNT_0000610813 /DNA_START=242 /DNA_END=1603 /DNA_ORIENTATION=+ /assembly_acc=CAM_ASM_000170